MDEYDLYNELRQKTDELNDAIASLKQTGRDRAKTERDYKVLLRKNCLAMRADGMAIGMIDKCCFGVPAVADARFNRDVADSVYTANLEAINSIKLQLRLIESQIEREWSNTK